MVMENFAGGIPVTELPEHFPRLRGRKISKATAWRYVLDGVLDANGTRVRLRSFKAGGRRFVLPEAIGEFIAALNSESAIAPSAAESARRNSEVSRALDALGC